MVLLREGKAIRILLIRVLSHALTCHCRTLQTNKKINASRFARYDRYKYAKTHPRLWISVNVFMYHVNCQLPEVMSESREPSKTAHILFRLISTVQDDIHQLAVLLP